MSLTTSRHLFAYRAQSSRKTSCNRVESGTVVSYSVLELLVEMCNLFEILLTALMMEAVT
jgi:hypothetical protein